MGTKRKGFVYMFELSPLGCSTMETRIFSKIANTTDKDQYMYYVN